jgi:ABC-2 type transport system permease protein
MNKLGTLVRAGLKANFGLANVKHRLFKEKKDLWLVPIIGLAVVSVIPLFYGIVQLITSVFLVLKPMGQERVILILGVLVGQLLILLFGVYYVISAFYFSRDLEFLVPLPLRPSAVMLSKFVVIMINEYLTMATIVLPVVVTFGILARSGVGFWINAALVYLALPIIPLGIASLPVVIMMRFVNLSRKKDLLILVGSLMLIVGSMALQAGLGHSSGPQTPSAALAAFLTSPDSLLNLISSRFPPSLWAAKAIAGGFSGEGLINLVLLMTTSLAVFAAMIVLAEMLFYRGLVGLSEMTGKKLKLTNEQMSRRMSTGRRAIAAIFGREWRIMNRTPIFLLNGIIIVILLPAIFVLIATTSRSSGSGDHDALMKVITSTNPLYVILATALFMTICGSLNGTSSSTFSREGAQFWISRIIPVAPREQVVAKFLHSYLVALLGIVTAAVVAVMVFHLKLVSLFAAAGLALVAGVLLTAMNMMIDLARPLLDWTNPQKAIKQNLNVLLAMFANIGLLTAAFFGVKAMIMAKVATNVVLGVLFLSLALLAVLSYRLLLKFADKRYPQIET